jgi:hypothetical protein
MSYVRDRCSMLKVTIIDGGADQEFVVEGKLTWPCVSELEAVWKATRQTHRGCGFVIDLSGMTAIDATGKEALMTMIGEGARLTAKGIFNKDLVKALMRKAHEVGASRNTR